MDELTWEEIIKVEPRVKMLYDEACKRTKESYGGEDDPWVVWTNYYKNDLENWVGSRSPNPDFYMDREAFHICEDMIMEALEARLTGEEEAPVKVESKHFSVSEDYRSVRLGEEHFALSPTQAEVIRILDEARKTGHPDMTWSSISSRMSSPASKMGDVFREPELRNKLIKKERKGMYALNV